jgi:hypothetical protein
MSREEMRKLLEVLDARERLMKEPCLEIQTGTTRLNVDLVL